MCSGVPSDRDSAKRQHGRSVGLQAHKNLGPLQSWPILPARPDCLLALASLDRSPLLKEGPDTALPPSLALVALKLGVKCASLTLLLM